MKNKPLISVLMPNYNCKKYLSEAIESILNQTYKNFEFIIVDDGSKDNSLKIIEKYSKKDKRIRSVPNKKNLGRPKTRNKLLSLISETSDYFLWMDSDDVVTKDLLEKKVKFLENHKKIDILGSSIDYVDENMNFIKRRTYPKNHNEILKSFLLFSPVSQGGLMLRSKIKENKYNQNYLVCQDYEMWSRLISKGYVFHNLNESFYKYRQFENQGKQKNLKMTIRNTIKIKSKFLFNSRFFSFKALIRYLTEVFLLLIPKKIILWLFYRLK